MPKNQFASPVLAIGLDAFDQAELRRRLDDGMLPNLAKLAELGPVSTLGPDTAGLGGMAWLSFVNGVTTPEHGWYFTKVWSPETGRVENANGSFLRHHPFWQPLLDSGVRLALLDVPYAPDPGPDFDGAYLNGWQTHDEEVLRTHPPDLLNELESRFGAPKLRPEQYGPQRPQDLLDLRQQAIDSVRQITEISEWVLKRDRFDLCVVVIGAAHRAGHYLWNLAQIDRNELTAAEVTTLEQAMDDIYLAVDEAVGRIVAVAPDYQVMAFAVHGMRANPGWNDVFPDILKALDAPEQDQPSSKGLRDYLHAFRRSPMALKVTRNLPAGVNRLISRTWAAKMHDWSKTRLFTLPGEVVGIVRFNVEGREPQGIVPAADALGAAEELAGKLREVRDLETGTPIAETVHVTDQLVGTEAPFRRFLPDILVEWGTPQLIESTGVQLPGGKSLRWERGRRVTSGRSGDHRQDGWLMGEIAVASRTNTPPTTVDLAHTLLDRFQSAKAAE
ncbi:MAG: alkaline phosphatase family protein [Pseudomonadota bacterium]